jgi:hypothetical protein
MEAEKFLEHALKVADGEYVSFSSDWHSILALSHPTMPGVKPISGPTGSSRTCAHAVAEFEDLDLNRRRTANTLLMVHTIGSREEPKRPLSR